MPSQLLDLWIRHTYGRLYTWSSEMFSFSYVLLYLTIRPIRHALTSFALQLIEHELILQARLAAQPTSGLNVHLPTEKTPMRPGVPTLDWRNLGKHTHATIAGIHQQFQPVLWGLLTTIVTAIATPDGYQVGEAKQRVRRPVVWLLLLLSRNSRLVAHLMHALGRSWRDHST
ncbi:hypothetical protein QCA50_018051 [Cerrena zonata]|uniref:Uncharacterized protein n=1 Tax=Cerrena zonata TaxID=2478898 RepID=A0AAW0FDZ2_9APHY